MNSNSRMSVLVILVGLMIAGAFVIFYRESSLPSPGQCTNVCYVSTTTQTISTTTALSTMTTSSSIQSQTSSSTTSVAATSSQAVPTCPSGYTYDQPSGFCYQNGYAPGQGGVIIPSSILSLEQVFSNPMYDLFYVAVAGLAYLATYAVLKRRRA